MSSLELYSLDDLTLNTYNMNSLNLPSQNNCRKLLVVLDTNTHIINLPFSRAYSPSC
jgi:hypothetical protein